MKRGFTSLLLSVYPLFIWILSGPLLLISGRTFGELLVKVILATIPLSIIASVVLAVQGIKKPLLPDDKKLSYMALVVILLYLLLTLLVVFVMNRIIWV